jgi:hypothetical protein
VIGGANGNGTIDGLVVVDTDRRLDRAAVVGTVANRDAGSTGGAVDVVVGSGGSVVVVSSGASVVLGVMTR